MKVAVVGDVMLDIYRLAEPHGISAETPNIRFMEAEEKRLLGGAGNAAFECRRLGAEVTLVGFVGDDREGEDLLRACEEVGVQWSGVTVPGRVTTTKTRVFSKGYELLRLDRETCSLAPDECRYLLGDKTLAACEGVNAILVADHAKGSISGAVVKAVMDGRGDKPVVVDPHPHGGTWADVCVTMLVPNRYELVALAGFESQELDPMLERVQHHWRADHWAVTLDGHGAAYCTGEETTLVPVPDGIKAVDVCGAGDAFAATVTYELSNGTDPLEAVRRAVARASETVTLPRLQRCGLD